jgi:hypothetical protein
MFLSPLGERPGEGECREYVISVSLTQPLPAFMVSEGGEEADLRGHLTHDDVGEGKTS